MPTAIKRTTVTLLAPLVLLAAGGSAPPGGGGGVAFASAPADAAGLHEVRFSGPITDAVHTRVERAGADIVGYRPVDAYIVWASPEQVARLGAEQEVSFVGPLDPDGKVHPLLVRAEERLTADVTFYGAALPDAVARLRRLIGSAPEVHSDDGMLATTTVELTRSQLDVVTRDPAVLSVAPAGDGPILEDEMSAQIVARNVDDAGRPQPGYVPWLASIGLDGDGVRVAVVDSGVSRHHPDLEGRVEPEPTIYDLLATADTYGHGTHVAGILGGAPRAPLDPSDPDGFRYGQGIAPAVRIVDLPLTNRYQEIATDAYRAGARMWNGSWSTGEGTRVGYIASARLMDVLTRDADPETPGNQEFLMVFSAGNGGEAGPTAPHEAKSIVTVGATRNGRLVTWPLTQDTESVGWFSSRGPTVDGRVFPTIVAPGASVVSARAPESTPPCVVPPDSFGLHASCGGTSMAAPHVTGASALVHQQWLQRRVTPSPAMVRALLVGSAQDIAEADIPNNDEGWGRLDLSALLARPAPVSVDQTILLRERGGSATVTVEATGGPLRATLAWTDAPALPGADPTLVNDLDLVVEQLAADGTVAATWYGNVYEGGRSVAGGSPDRLHTLEDVLLPTPAEAAYRIRVTAANLPGDGVPDNADPTDQDYALVIHAATTPPAP